MAQAGLARSRDHPWFGVGDSLESFQRDSQTVQGWYRRYRPQAVEQWPSLRDKEEGHLHDDFITLAALYGLPALALALCFFWKLGRQAWSRASLPAPLASGLGLGFAAALLGWWVNGLFEYNFGSLQSSFVLWFLCGLFFAGTASLRPAHE
jgi:O-antigen ligase